jgi:hypothetical protein
MAKQFCRSSPSLEVSGCRACRNNLSKAAGALLALDAALFGAISVNAQTPPQQQYVYASVPVTTTTSEIAGFSKNGLNGGLAGVSGSPFTDQFQGGSMAIDGLGHFLFVVNLSTSNISMFQIDQATGSLTEVQGSPFAVGPTENPTTAPTAPICLATESSGRFLYVGYRKGNFQGESAVIEYQIDSSTPRLIPPSTVAGNTDIPSAPLAIVTDPKGLYLYVGLGPNPTLAAQPGTTNVYPIDGQLPSSPLGTAGGLNQHERAIAIDPRGRFFFDGWGSNEGFIESAPINHADGTATQVTPAFSLGLGKFPPAMLVESSGKFLYVEQSDGVAVYSIDPSTGALTQSQPPTPILNFQIGSAAADPISPYVYVLESTGVHGFQVDPQSGVLSEIPGSPFPGASGGVLGLTISGASTQAVSGPAAELFPPSKDFGSVTVGQSSSTQVLNLTNTGGEVVSLSSVSVKGANQNDFTLHSNCPALLPLNSSCTLSVVFAPTAAGLRQATLNVNDTAGVQFSQLTGTGVAPQPAVTLMPGSLSFPATAQGATSAAQTITVANSGAATLHISSVLLSGANPGDFNIVTNGCSGAYQVNASCVISVSFSPFADGLRTASISIADDAPNSPQSVQLSGTGTGQPVSRPALTVAPGTVFFPTVTQGLTSGPQKVTLTSAGSAPLHISLVLLGGANRDDFSIPNDCTAPAYAPNATCTINVTFAPLMSGPRAATATISITDDASGSPQTLSINGNVAPAFTVTPSASGSLSATVTAGQTAAYNLQVIPAPDFVGSISFSCTGAPLAATCTVPQPLQLNGSAVPFTVRVATTGSGTIASFFRAPRLPPFPGLRILPLLTLFVLVLLVCSMYGNLRRNAPGRRMIYSGLSAVWIVIALFDVAGCGGGCSAAQSAPITQPAVTPQGTSTISVTLTASTASGKQLAPAPPVQLTLTVK